MDIKQSIMEAFSEIDFYYYQEAFDDNGFEVLIVSNDNDNKSKSQFVFAFRFVIDGVILFVKNNNGLCVNTSIIKYNEINLYIRATTSLIKLKGIEYYINELKKIEKKFTND